MFLTIKPYLHLNYAVDSYCCSGFTQDTALVTTKPTHDAAEAERVEAR